MIQERKHQNENVPQRKRQLSPNHKHLRTSHKTHPALNNSHKTNLLLKSNNKTCPCLNKSHKKSPPWNSSHKVRPPLKNNNKMYQNPILFHPTPAVMMHFKIILQCSSCFLQNIPALYQRSLDTAQNHHNTSFKSILLSIILSFQSMQRKTNYLWTCNIFELSANVPKFIFSFKCNVILYQLFFKADAVKVLPQHYDLYIYFLFTALSQFDKYYFLLQYESDVQLTTFCFFSSSH